MTSDVATVEKREPPKHFAYMALISAILGLVGGVVVSWQWKRIGPRYQHVDLLAFSLSIIGMLGGIVTFILSVRGRVGGRWAALGAALLGGLPVAFLSLLFFASPRYPVDYEDGAAILLSRWARMSRELKSIEKGTPYMGVKQAGTNGRGFSVSGDWRYEVRDCLTIGGKTINWEEAFAFCATPQAYGEGTRRTYIVKTDGVVWAKDLGKAQLLDDFPADPARDGWVKTIEADGTVCAVGAVGAQPTVPGSEATKKGEKGDDGGQKELKDEAR